MGSDFSSPPEFKQSKFLRGRRQIRLLDNGFEYSLSTPGETFETVVSYADFDPTPVRQKRTRKSALAACAACFLIAAGILGAGIKIAWGAEEFWGMVFLAGVFFSFSCATVVYYLSNSFDFLIFRNVVGGVTVTLYYNLPDRARFEEMKTELASRISTHSLVTRNRERLAAPDLLDCLDALLGGAIVDETEYQSLKTRIGHLSRDRNLH